MSFLIFIDPLDDVIHAYKQQGDDETISQYAQKRPDLQPAYVDFLPEGVECGPLATTKWRFLESTGTVEQIIPSDEEKANVLRRKIADKYNAECSQKIQTSFSINGQPVNLTRDRIVEFLAMSAHPELFTYPYGLKINSDENSCPVKITLKKDELLMEISEGILFYKKCLDECNDKKEALAKMALAELEELL